MKLRYKETKVETQGTYFNLHGLSEVLTGDDSVPISNLEVFLEQKQEWKDMDQAFLEHDLIVDTYNAWFLEPPSEEDRKRGYLE